jgi:hypothetical protein
VLSAADYEQKHGPAVLRLLAEKIDGGKVEIRLSDSIPLTLIVEGGPALEVQPIERLLATSDWQVADESKPEITSLPRGRVHWQQSYRLQPRKPGDVPLVLSPLRFREDRLEDNWQQVRWKPISVQVTTEILEADLRELRDGIRPEPLPPLPSWRWPLIWAGLMVALVGLVVAGWEVVRRRGAHAPEEPPAQRALRELQELQSRPLDSEAAAKDAHTLLADIVRRYIESRFHLPALEQTTAEFLEAMRHSPDLTTEQQSALGDLLRRCDLAKFARAYLACDEFRTQAAAAADFVRQSATSGKAQLLR